MAELLRPDICVIGAGPYGLSIAACLHDYGVNTRVFGIPLDTWRDHMRFVHSVDGTRFAPTSVDTGGQR